MTILLISFRLFICYLKHAPIVAPKMISDALDFTVYGLSMRSSLVLNVRLILKADIQINIQAHARERLLPLSWSRWLGFVILFYSYYYFALDLSCFKMPERFSRIA